MNKQQALRFESDYLPRIAARVAGLLGPRVRIDCIVHEGSTLPSRLHVRAARHASGERASRYAFDLNITLTWDDDEIERLLQPGGEARFLRYLDSIDAKFDAWQGVREVDLKSCSQAEAAVLLGGLDFEP